MANPGYVRSTDGSDADNGSTWALANATLTGAASDAAAGDRIWVSDNHAESTAGAVTLNFPGTLAAPNQVLCGDDAAEPPTALAATATVATTGVNALQVNGSFYMYGITFNCGSGNASVDLTLQGSAVNSSSVFDNCVFVLVTTHASANFQIGAADAVQREVRLINCQFKFANAASYIDIENAKVIIEGGSIASGSTALTSALFSQMAAGRGVNLICDGFDFTNLGASCSLVNVSNSGQAMHIVFRNCKLPASWTGTLVTGSFLGPGIRIEMWNCSNADTNYVMEIQDYAGSVKHETTIVRTGGASDGDTPISWKMAANSNAEYPTLPLRSPEIYVPNTAIGSSKTLTVEIARDGSATAVNDDEAWLEVEYLGTNGTPLALFANDAKASVIATAAAQADSSESWSGLGGTNKKQKLSVSVTPQEEGVFICRVCLAAFSQTIYVDPKVTVT